MCLCVCVCAWSSVSRMGSAPLLVRSHCLFLPSSLSALQLSFSVWFVFYRMRRCAHVLPHFLRLLLCVFVYFCCFISGAGAGWR